MKLSAAVITYNEELNIGRFLENISDLADEIIVVDSFSTDRTREIALQFPKVRFVENRFEGFGKQKNFALEQCSGDWILFLDADEIPDETAKNAIRKVLRDGAAADVFLMAFNNIFLGKNVRFGGWGNVYRERFFRKNAGQFDDAFVHEKFLTGQKKEILPGRINHFTYRDIYHHIEKSNKYTTMMAQKMNRAGKKSSVGKIIFSPLFQFLKLYFFKMGFRDGLVGFYAAITASFYTFLKYIKLHELQNS